MRKNALTITLAALVLSIFGAFLRWLQTRNIFEEETGLALRGAPISIIYVVYSVLALAVIAAVALGWLRRYTAAAEPAQALHTETAVPMILTVALAVIFLCAALAVLFSAETSRAPLLQRVFGAFAIFGGLCFPFLTPKRSGSFASAGSAASVVLTLFCCFWMIFAYKLHAESPILWAYAPEMLALAATTLAVYEIAAWFHGRAKIVRALIALYFAAFLDFSVVFDARSTGLTVMLAVAAALMLLLGYLLIANLNERGD